MARLCCVLGARLLGPGLEGQGTRGPVVPRCGPVTSRTEVAIDESVGRQEALRLRRRFEPLHLPLSPAGWSMRILRAIVEVAALPMLDIRQQLSLRRAVASQLIGDQDAQYILQTLQQPPEAALRRPGVAPQVVQLALDPDEDLIQMPFVAAGAADAGADCSRSSRRTSGTTAECSRRRRSRRARPGSARHPESSG